MRFKISCHVEAITCLSISIVLLSDIVICISIFLLRFYAMLTLMNWDPVFGFAPCLALALGIYSCITSAYGCVIICSRHRGVLAFFAVLTTVAFIAQVVSILLFLQLQPSLDFLLRFQSCRKELQMLSLKFQLLLDSSQLCFFCTTCALKD